MNTRPLISITTPCWNSGKTIERTIKSVLEQKFKDYEYIIVDGGSTDSTLDIIKKYETQFEGRMRWYSERDNGIYDAFNKGIKHSKGYFCWNVNSDDWLEPDALFNLELYMKANLNRACILCCRLNMNDGNNVRTLPMVTHEGIKKSADKMLFMGIIHPASIYSKLVYDKIGIYDDRYYISGDMDHFIRCYRSSKVDFIPLDLVVTNMADGGVSNTFNFRKFNHDRQLRFSKFTSNRFIAYYYITLSNIIFLKRWLSKKIANSITNFRSNLHI